MTSMRSSSGPGIVSSTLAVHMNSTCAEQTATIKHMFKLCKQQLGLCPAHGRCTWTAPAAEGRLRKSCVCNVRVCPAHWRLRQEQVFLGLAAQTYWKTASRGQAMSNAAADIATRLGKLNRCIQVVIQEARVLLSLQPQPTADTP